VSDRSGVAVGLVVPAMMTLGVMMALMVLTGGLALPFVLRGAAVADRRHLAAAAASALLAALALQMACGSNNAGTASTTVSTNPSSLTFSSQSTGTTAPPQAVTLTNTGQAALAISGISASGDFSATNSCGSSLAAGGSCTITVTFTPTAAGSRTGTITITDSASGSPQKISLMGTGVNSTGSTPAGTFQVTVNGSSGTLVISGTITLTVQ
jgi:Abnormal spindle-like microcephaly-assoc'd, ASPM-SPD-2-Hydin